MSFWTGFLVGVGVTYGVSVGVAIAVVWYANRKTYVEIPPRPECPEYPTVPFSHLTNIGHSVKGQG